MQILNYLDLLVGRFTQAQELMVGGEPLLRGRGGALQVYYGRNFTGILGALLYRYTWSVVVRTGIQYTGAEIYRYTGA